MENWTLASISRIIVSQRILGQKLPASPRRNDLESVIVHAGRDVYKINGQRLESHGISVSNAILYNPPLRTNIISLYEYSNF